MSWSKIKRLFKKKKIIKETPIQSRHIGHDVYDINGTFVRAKSHSCAVRQYKNAL